MGMDLSDFERRMASKEFVKIAFDAFLKTRELETGISDLRLRTGDFNKKLVEEILPIAVFIGSFERVGLNVECQYFSGDQSYDARLYCDGLLVEKKSVLNEYYIEVSLACHPKDYLKRQATEQGVPVFGGNQIEKVNGIISSLPSVRTIDSIISEHFDFINQRIAKKASGSYPDNTYLIVPLFPDTLILWNEWTSIIGKFSSCITAMPFSGIFIYDTVSNRKCLF